MCGIVGVWHLDGRPCPRELVDAMRDRLVSRGPDDADSWTQGSVGLGHRRLSILDLSPAGRQPMSVSGGAYRITFNGEIYNYRQLRRELAGDGFDFATGTDTEVLLAAYRKWGAACVERLVGMFAFAIWDETRQGIFLARDRLGQKPLFYTHRADRAFVFASRLSALMIHPDTPQAMDRDSLRLFLQIGFVPGPRSILEDVHKLPPGTSLWVDHEGLTHRTYWSADRIEPDPTLRGVSLRAAADELERRLTEAVELRLVSDVPLGAFLSGGVDSSVVVSLMRKIGEGVPKTFAIGFREGRYNETHQARAVARHLGTEHHERVMDSSDLLMLLDDHAVHYDEPFGDWSSLPTMMVSRFAREHVTVALTGDGGDELFMGYPFHVITRGLSRAFALPRALRFSIAAGLKRSGRHRLRLLGHALGEHSVVHAFAFMRSMSKDIDLNGLMHGSSADIRDEFLARARTLPPLSAAATVARLDTSIFLPDDILQKVDVASMSVGLEARCPLLDHRVVEYALALPDRVKLSGRGTKIVLREVLRRHLPEALVDRPKAGFEAPIREWFRSELRDLISDELSPGRLEPLGYILPETVEHLIREHLSGARDRHAVLWALLNLVRWNEMARDMRLLAGRWAG